MNANAAPLVGYAVMLGENGLVLKLATYSKLGLYQFVEGFGGHRSQFAV